MSVDVVVSLEDGLEPSDITGTVEDAVRHVLISEDVTMAEVSVALVTDDTIARLNQEYLAHEGPTDVISFPLRHPGGVVVGDIYIGASQAERQAAALDIPVEEEIVRLAIHGTLHILGYDHPDDENGRAQSEMFVRQEDLLTEVLRDRD